MDNMANRSRWNIDEARELVLQLYDVDQLDLASPSLRSICDRQRYAHFHYREATKLHDNFVAEHLSDACLLSVALGVKEGSANEFHIFTTKVGAHFTACIQSLHAVPDILAYAIYHSLAFNLSSRPLDPRNISSTSVLKLMNSSPEFAELRTLFEQFLTGGSFSHLNALVNLGKHRSVVRASLSENYMADLAERYTLDAPAVEFNGNRYPQVSIKDFLRPEYSRCSILTVDIGNALNHVLRQRVCCQYIAR
jgi:hypothetical protein